MEPPEPIFWLDDLDEIDNGERFVEWMKKYEEWYQHEQSQEEPKA